MYGFLDRNPELLASRFHFRILSANKGPEKGPDFIGINRQGQLVLGEIKAGPLNRGRLASNQGLREEVWEHVRRGGRFTSLGSAGRNLLSSKAKRALYYPSRRRLQLVLVAEMFSDQVLREIEKKGRTVSIRRFVKDVKCVEMQVFKVRAIGTIVAAAIVSGRARQLGR
jgi:hypothetical protein